MLVAWSVKMRPPEKVKAIAATLPMCLPLPSSPFSSSPSSDNTEPTIATFTGRSACEPKGPVETVDCHREYSSMREPRVPSSSGRLQRGQRAVALIPVGFSQEPGPGTVSLQRNVELRVLAFCRSGLRHHRSE
jgi:hypothetical protein